jgi:hypothetical protein
MKNSLNIKSIAAGVLFLGAIVLAGCNKDEAVVRGGGNSFGKGKVVKSITLNPDQARTAKDAYGRMPKLRFYDQVNNRFIDMKMDGSRDLVFSDPDEGFSFDDPDNNGMILFSDGSGDYLVFSTGIGVAGQGGGGVVVAGNTTLNIDLAMCISAEAVAAGDGYGDLFDTGFAFNRFAAVFGIAGDFEELANANTSAEDFDPFQYFQGFAVYYILADDISGSHEVFDWLGANSEDEDTFEDMASSMVIDFQNFDLYFATSGTVTASGGQMMFSGEYLSLIDLFESFLDDGVDDSNIDYDIVSGFGTMGCN